jgi:hypothetical protein
MTVTRIRTARPLGWHPVSLRVAAGSPEAELLNRWAPVYGGRSAALRAGLAALDSLPLSITPSDEGPPPPGR